MLSVNPSYVPNFEGYPCMTKQRYYNNTNNTNTNAIGTNYQNQRFPGMMTQIVQPMPNTTMQHHTSFPPHPMSLAPQHLAPHVQRTHLRRSISQPIPYVFNSTNRSQHSSQQICNAQTVPLPRTPLSPLGPEATSPLGPFNIVDFKRDIDEIDRELDMQNRQHSASNASLSGTTNTNTNTNTAEMPMMTPNTPGTSRYPSFEVDENIISKHMWAQLDSKPQQTQQQQQQQQQATKTTKRKKKKSKRSSKMNRDIGYEPHMLYRAQGNIQISKSLTEKVIPSMIAERISNVYSYMDKSYALSVSSVCDSNVANNDSTFKIINYDFHHKVSGELLYCLMIRQDTMTSKSRGYQWRMINKLFTAAELFEEYGVASHELPVTFRHTDEYARQMAEAAHIRKLLEKRDTRRAMIDGQAWHKVSVLNRVNNKRRMTLSLTKPEFIRQCRMFCEQAQEQEMSPRLLPIVMFNKESNQHWIEHVWLVTIDEGIDIGISLRLADPQQLKVCGVHLDKKFLQNQHELVMLKHDCHCLDGFRSHVSDLRIGNPDDLQNKINYYRQVIDDISNYKDYLKEFMSIDANVQNVYQFRALQQKFAQCTDIPMASGSSSDEAPVPMPVPVAAPAPPAVPRAPSAPPSIHASARQIQRMHIQVPMRHQSRGSPASYSSTGSSQQTLTPIMNSRAGQALPSYSPSFVGKANQFMAQ